MTGGLNNSCINCGKSDHETRNCPEPRREKHERPCWKCGKKGHMAYKCPDKDTPAKAVSAGAMTAMKADELLQRYEADTAQPDMYPSGPSGRRARL